MLTSACDPVSDRERQYLEERDRQRESEQELLRIMTEANTADAAIELVKAAAAPEGFVGNVESWLSRQRDAIEGDVLFPKWEGQRRGANRFDVRYTHTVIDYDYNITRSGYAWDVDTMLKIVTGPVDIDPSELEEKPRRTTASELPALQTEDFSLE